MSHAFKNLFVKYGRESSTDARLDLVDRSEVCPAFMSLTALTEDLDLVRYIRARVRQLKSEFRDEVVFPEPSDAPKICSCSSARASHQRLAKKIKGQKTGWQDELADLLVPYVMSHISANIVSNIHRVLIVSGTLNWRDFVERQNRNNPSAVLEAAGIAMHARFMLQKAALKKCAVMGALLNVIKQHWLGCEWFRAGHKGNFSEHTYMRHELFLEALKTYGEQPTQETLESCADDLRWSLAALSCPLKFEHPEIHQVELGPAAEPVEQLEDDKASQSSNDAGKGCSCPREKKGVCDVPGCRAQTSSSIT